MVKESGRIIAVEKDAVWVETIQQSTCGSCSARKGCGQSLLSKIGANTGYLRVLLSDLNSKSYRVDQCVTIGIPNDVVLKGSLLLYLTPLFFMLVFSGIAHNYISSDLFSMAAGALGLLLGGGLMRLHSLWTKSQRRWQPVLIDEISDVVFVAQPKEA